MKDIKQLLNKTGLAALFLIISWGFWKVLTGPGCYWFAHDLLLALQRMAVTARAIGDGQLYPRWSGELYGGYGYPLLQFYPPLFSLLGAALHAAGFSFLNAMKLLVMVSICTGGWFTYLWLRPHGNRIAAFTAALAFTCFPYHVVVLKIRGAVSELLAMSIFPLILLALDRLIRKGRRRDLLLTTTATALLMLAHNGSFLFFVPGSLVVLVVMNRPFRPASLYRGAAALAAGMAVTAFYWLPAILEKRFIHIDRMINSVNINYRDHLTAIHDIFNRKWGYGGLGWLLLGATGLCFILALFPASRRRFPRMVWLMPLLATIYLFMTSLPSRALWDHLPLLQLIGFPFRLFGPAGLFAAAALFLVMEILSDRFPAAAVRSIIFLASAALLISTPIMQASMHPHQFNERYLMSSDGIRKSTSSTVVADEYAPLWVTKKPVDDLGVAFAPAQPFLHGDVAVETDISHEKTLVVWAEKPGVLRLNTIYFPGWTVTLDGKPTPERHDNPYGLMELDIPAGTHKIRAVFTATPIRRIADGISLAGILLLLGIALAGFRKTTTMTSRRIHP